MKRRICLLLAATALATLALTACGRKAKLSWDNYGRAQDIPCITIPNGQYAETEYFRYAFRKGRTPGIDSEWGTLTKVEAETIPVVNQVYGEDMYLTRYVNTTVDTYRQLVSDMELAGFQIYAQSNLGEEVYHTVLTYQENSYTVTHIAGTGQIDVTASDQMLLSPHLQQDNDSTRAQHIAGIGAKARFIKPRSTGSGFVIQLKNGNFVIMDGGNYFDLNNLLTFMEENTPEGQIPVVEAWFVTYSDYDRTGWTTGFTGSNASLKYTKELLEPVLAKERLYVNGIYYNPPDAAVYDITGYKEKDTVDGVTYYEKAPNGWAVRVDAVASVLKTQSGIQTPIYRPMTGQTFHFSGGLTVEVACSQEQISLSEYELDLKASSTSYVVRAEGRSLYAMGSSNLTTQGRIAQTYSQDYLGAMDVLIPPHHGRRLYEQYQDTFKAPIMIFEAKNLTEFTGESKTVAACYTQDPDIQCFSYADGTLVYDFATGKVSVQ